MRFGRACGERSDDEMERATMSEWREIRLPEDLCAAAEQKFGASFRSLDELLTFLLQELISKNTMDLDRADQAIVEDRLRDLGYI
jgi:hypothetical protein